jgi:peptidyl-prolyl cis-trans isomerase C
MRYLLWLLPLAALLFSCTGQKQKGTPLAQVGNEVLTLESFRSSFSEEQWNSLTAEQKKQYTEDWVNVTLLALEADRQKLAEEPSVKQRLDYAEKKVKANALIASRLADVRISEDQLFNYYRIHQGDFQSKMMEYNVQRILLKDENTARILLKRIEDGYGFDEAAASHSQESLKDNIGRMGFIVASGPDSLFWKAARDLKQNTPGMFNTADGFYILRWTEQREGSQEANFEEYRGEIRSILLREKQRQVYEDLVRELKAQTDKVFYY